MQKQLRKAAVRQAQRVRSAAAALARNKTELGLLLGLAALHPSLAS